VPLPEKRPAEKHDAFIQRCMGDGVMVREFPDAAQRRAVCERQWKKGATRMSSEVKPQFVTMKAPLTVEAAGDGKDMPRFRMVAYTGGLMQLAGFPHPVVVDLAGLEVPDAVPLLTNHENRTGARVGMVKARVEDVTLVIEGEILSSSGQARGIVEQARAVEPTNNLAERIVRQGVLWRKSSFGTQSEHGAGYVERMLTTCATCRLQRRSIIQYLRAACRCHSDGIAAPSLVNTGHH